MKPTLYLLCMLVFAQACISQTVTLSQQIESSDHDFAIIGKHNNETLVYNSSFRTSAKDKHKLLVYDSAMNLIQQSTIPLPLRVYGLRFFMRNNFFYVLYQVQEGRTIYLMAEKIGVDGKMIGEPKELDHTAKVDYWAENKIYSIIESENKKYLTAFKVFSPEAVNTTVTTLLFDEGLTLLRRSDLYAPLEDGITFFSEFNLDNEGNFVFLRDCKLADIEQVSKKVGMVIKQALSDSVYFINPLPKDIYVKDVRLTIDNLNKRYMATTFYSSTAKRNIDGLYCYVMDAQNHEQLYARKVNLEEPLKKEVWARGTLKEAFNNFSITSMHKRKDGGFVLDAGSYSGIAAAGKWHASWVQNTYKLPCGYIFYEDNPNHWYDSYSKGVLDLNSIADNIAIFSFDSTALPEWIKVLHSSQMGNPYSVPFFTAETGEKLMYLHNETNSHHTNFLTTQVVDEEGEIGHDLVYKDMEKLVASNLLFMPSLGLQVNTKEVIMPCRNGRYICFAKINY